MSLEAAFVDAVRRAGVARSDLLGLAVSGGADSMAMLHLAAATRVADLHVFHVDHGLRPATDLDAEFVAEAAQGLGVPADVLRVRVERAPRESLEAVARDERYAALETASVRAGCRHVATAHTLDDQAETVLLRLMRGTGISGLSGIAAVRGRFVRPLLGCARDELRAWATSNGVVWREDPTNADTAFERNWVRRELLAPMAARRPGVARTLARLAEHATSEAEALDDLAASALGRCVLDGDVVLIPACELAVPDAVAARIVRGAVARLGGRADTATVRRVLGLDVSGQVACGGRVSVWRTAHEVVVVREPLPAAPPVVLPEGETAAEAWGVRVRVGDGVGGAWRWRCTVPDGGSLQLRPRRPGDRVATPAGTRKVSDVLIDAKVPRPLRERVPVLAHATSPVAVVGLTAPPVGSMSGRNRVVDVEPLQGAWLGGRWWKASRRAT